MKPFSILAILLLAGCSDVPSRPGPDLSSSIQAAHSAIARAQHAAASISSSNPAAVADLRTQLGELGIAFDTISGKAQWYETDWKRLNEANTAKDHTLSQKDVTIADQKRALHQTAKERDFYPLVLALLSSVLVGVAFVPWALKLPGLLGFVVPPALVVGGGVFGFTASRMLAAWGSRLMP